MTARFLWTNRQPLRVAVGVAVEKVALEIERDAKAACPVLTGNLRRSIQTVTQPTTPDKATATVGTNVYYAPFVEFGTGRQRAQPYLGPALERARGRYGA